MGMGTETATAGRERHPWKSACAQGENFPRKQGPTPPAPGRNPQSIRKPPARDAARGPGACGRPVSPDRSTSAESRWPASETPELHWGLCVLQKPISLTPLELKHRLSSVSPPDPSSFPTYNYPSPRPLSVSPFSHPQTLSVLSLNFLRGAHSTFPRLFQPSSQILSISLHKFPPFPPSRLLGEVLACLPHTPSAFSLGLYQSFSRFPSFSSLIPFLDGVRRPPPPPPASSPLTCSAVSSGLPPSYLQGEDRRGRGNTCPASPHLVSPPTWSQRSQLR